jgi:hypothetical protein
VLFLAKARRTTTEMVTVDGGTSAGALSGCGGGLLVVGDGGSSFLH